MALISTKQLIQEFISSEEFTKKRYTPKMIDREEIYEYEEKIGKQLMDMNADDIIGLLASLRSHRAGTKSENSKLTQGAYTQIASLIRKLFDYYSIHYELILNPFVDPRLKGLKLYQSVFAIRDDSDRFTRADFDRILKSIRIVYSLDRARYYTALIMLFYEGVQTYEELVGIKEEDINEKLCTVRLPNRTIKLTDETFGLLQYVHSLSSLSGNTNNVVYMVSYHDSYIKILTRKPEQVESKTLVDALNPIRSALNKSIKVAFELSRFTLPMMFYFGFYEYLIKKYGEEETRTMVLNTQDRASGGELIESCAEYNIVIKNNNVRTVRTMLMNFI